MKTLLAIALVAPLLLVALWMPTSGQSAEPALSGAALEYKDGETLCEGYLASPKDETKRAGVLIVHDWMGPRQFDKDKADALAKLGYVALSVDMYGKGVRPKNVEEARTNAMKFYGDPKAAVARIRAAYDTLKAHKNVDAKRIACMGFCFGGSITLALARDGAELAAAVSFHGGLKNIQGKSDIKCPVLILHGADDPFVAAEDVDALKEEFRTGKVDWQFVEFGNSVHSFTNPDAGTDNSKGAAFNEKANARSWEMMKDFLAATLK